MSARTAGVDRNVEIYFIVVVSIGLYTQKHPGPALANLAHFAETSSPQIAYAAAAAASLLPTATNYLTL